MPIRAAIGVAIASEREQRPVPHRGTRQPGVDERELALDRGVVGPHAWQHCAQQRDQVGQQSVGGLRFAHMQLTDAAERVEQHLRLDARLQREQWRACTRCSLRTRSVSAACSPRIRALGDAPVRVDRHAEASLQEICLVRVETDVTGRPHARQLHSRRRSMTTAANPTTINMARAVGATGGTPSLYASSATMPRRPAAAFARPAAGQETGDRLVRAASREEPGTAERRQSRQGRRSAPPERPDASRIVATPARSMRRVPQGAVARRTRRCERAHAAGNGSSIGDDAARLVDAQRQPGRASVHRPQARADVGQPGAGAETSDRGRGRYRPRRARACLRRCSHRC